eukprot:7417270-Pyramimonas_sp.AAC.1
MYSESEPITGDTRAYTLSWNQSQEIQEHVLRVGTNHRRYKRDTTAYRPQKLATALQLTGRLMALPSTPANHP